MPYKFDKFRRIVSVFLLSGFFALSFSFLSIRPALALDGAAGWAYNTIWSTKEFGLDTAARFLARGLLSNTINTMIRKIQTSGRQGRSASFVQNWRRFLVQSQHRGEDVFRRILGNTTFCNYLQGDLRTIFRADTVLLDNDQTEEVRAWNLDPFKRRGKCTMPPGWTVENFQRDFSGNGGWEALARLAQPQNNFYGAFLMSLEELAVQRALDTEADSIEAQSGGGFTGIRQGPTTGGAPNSCGEPPVLGYCSGSGIPCNPKNIGPGGVYLDCATVYGPPDPNGPLSSYTQCVGAQRVPSQARCTFLGNVITPAKLLGDATSQTIDKNIGWLITSDEISEVIVAVISAVTQRLNNFMSDIGKDAPARQGSKPPRSQPGILDDPYSDCVVNQCSGQSGEDYSRCLNQCSSRAGIPQPGQPPSSPNAMMELIMTATV